MKKCDDVQYEHIIIRTRQLTLTFGKIIFVCECECVCVCVRKRVCVCDREKESVCVRERKRNCVYFLSDAVWIGLRGEKDTAFIKSFLKQTNFLV